jgi:predicted RNase H-like HicB family nuclease
MAHILDVYWSAEDSVFVAIVPDLPGCMAHGDSQDDALANVRDAIQLWMDTAREFGDPVPELRDFRREPHD